MQKYATPPILSVLHGSEPPTIQCSSNSTFTSTTVFPAIEEADGNSEEGKREWIGWTNTLRKRRNLSVRVNRQVGMDRTQGWAGRRNKNKRD